MKTECPDCNSELNIGYGPDKELYLFCPGCYRVYDMIPMYTPAFKYADSIKIITTKI